MVTSSGDYALYLLSAANGITPYSTSSSSFTSLYTGYSFPTDSRGRAVLPTMATLEAASDPESKLTIAGQLADVVQIQADAATQTGLPNRVAAMTAQCKEVLTAVETIINGLKTTDGSVAAGDADPALEPYQKAISRVLGTLHSTLTKVSALLSKADKEVAAQTDKDIARLDITAAGLACLSDLEWESLPSLNTASTFQADPTKLVDILV
ncbi:hypothetical protein [Shumkonia mesophila]|uniref:hypothetical protein n=1 Tax=Shumkonia mesophila TaxID=2838854 RepID=UPI0029349184|nr:hypothetical protein [Shumkonia mesophila]